MKKRFFFIKEYEMSDFEPVLSREEIIKRGRILIIDDERPLLYGELQKAGFSVDYDADGSDTTQIEKQIYDVIILDFGGVGLKYGKDQGLSLLRHIRRVAPSAVVLAYTSKALGASQSDFFRLSHDILEKDEGISDSLKCIENALRRAMTVENLWGAIVALTGITPDSSQEKEMRSCLIKAMQNQNISEIKKALSKITQAGIGLAVDSLLSGIFALARKNG